MTTRKPAKTTKEKSKPTKAVNKSGIKFEPIPADAECVKPMGAMVEGKPGISPKQARF